MKATIFSRRCSSSKQAYQILLMSKLKAITLVPYLKVAVIIYGGDNV